ncbi:MAG TPA: SpoIID/LytB domain-containing protein [Bryobacteraceae bacterium]|nr:SpoIID/LytB domain-containing protein [Bryobacteraceae bacterium]
MRKALLCFLLAVALPALSQTVDIGVFTLFKPVELRVSPAFTPILITTNATSKILEGRQSFTVRVAQRTAPVRVTSRDGAAADFHLSIPGKIDRQFHGILTIRPRGHKLEAVVSIDREIAVASVVAAEMTPNAPLEALKAQAVAARSYYAAAGRRHDTFDFCDTTHCQFLRAWPNPASPAFRAAQETRGITLEYAGKPLAALYSASCGGQTRALADTADGYPYYSVPCDFCRRHAPGIVRGHQLGLCQNGAAGMAAAGADFQAILDHYFPGTSLAQNRLNAIFLLPVPPPLRHSKD